MQFPHLTCMAIPATSTHAFLETASRTQIAQGAEARVWECDFLKRRAVVKQRFNKTYRHPVLDETLTAQRLKAEVRCMVRARKLGVVTPVPYHVEMQAASIYMEFVKGSSVKEVCSMMKCLLTIRVTDCT